MGRISVHQSHQVMSTLATNTDWDQIDFEKSGLQDRIVCNAKEAGRQFTAFLKNGARMIMTVLSVFKTIKVGTGPKDTDGFRSALKDAGCKISNWSNDILGKPGFRVAAQPADIDLVVLTTTQLTGKSDDGTTAEVFAGAVRLELEECAPDDGPQLRLQYLDQPLGECLRMGMEPITDSNGDFRVFSVGHNDVGLWLYANYANPNLHWHGGLLWVFRRRK